MCELLLLVSHIATCDSLVRYSLASTSTVVYFVKGILHGSVSNATSNLFRDFSFFFLEGGYFYLFFGEFLHRLRGSSINRESRAFFPNSSNAYATLQTMQAMGVLCRGRYLHYLSLFLRLQDRLTLLLSTTRGLDLFVLGVSWVDGSLVGVAGLFIIRYANYFLAMSKGGEGNTTFVSRLGYYLSLPFLGIRFSNGCLGGVRFCLSPIISGLPRTTFSSLRDF